MRVSQHSSVRTKKLPGNKDLEKIYFFIHFDHENIKKTGILMAVWIVFSAALTAQNGPRLSIVNSCWKLSTNLSLRPIQFNYGAGYKANVYRTWDV